MAISIKLPDFFYEPFKGSYQGYLGDTQALQNEYDNYVSLILKENNGLISAWQSRMDVDGELMALSQGNFTQVQPDILNGDMYINILSYRKRWLIGLFWKVYQRLKADKNGSYYATNNVPIAEKHMAAFLMFWKLSGEDKYNEEKRLAGGYGAVERVWMWFGLFGELIKADGFVKPTVANWGYAHCAETFNRLHAMYNKLALGGRW